MTKQKFLWLVKKYYKTLVYQARYYSKGKEGEEIVSSFVVYILNRKAHLAVNGSNRQLKNWLYVCIRNQAWRASRLEQLEPSSLGEEEIHYTPELLELQTDVRAAMSVLCAEDKVIAESILMGNDTYESVAKLLSIKPLEVMAKVEELKEFFSAYLPAYNVGKLKGKSS